MLIDARTITSNTIIQTDVCIVGGGAAGITLAREFIGQPFRLCLLESGGLEFDQHTQSLYDGRTNGGAGPYSSADRLEPGGNILSTVRLRYFGGTTNHWGGYCRPFDEIDFEVRDWIPHSGWPFRKSHLAPFYDRAQSICQLGPPVYDARPWETKDTPHLPFIGDRVITNIIQMSPPTRFGKAYREEIKQADNIHTYLYANVVNIETTDNAQSVARLQVATLQGNKFWLFAKLFVLAAGGIENPRLLLLSNKVQAAGLGNQNDLVGRFFMDHLEVAASLFLPSRSNMPLGLYETHPATMRGMPNIRGILTLSAETLRHEKLVNFTSELEPAELTAVDSLRYLLRGIRQRDFVRHLRNMIADIDDFAAITYRKYLSGPIGVYRFMHFCEQVPNPNSRVMLSRERDKLGQNRVQLDWRLSPLDRQNLRRGYEILAQEIGRAGLGRLKITLDGDDLTWPTPGSVHHMGTTRMNVDPQKGVVNEHCQVHGISNLFIAGSSTFPTSSSAYPTLTIVALALRLADYIKKRLT